MILPGNSTVELKEFDMPKPGHGQVFLWPGANDWHDLWDEDGTIVDCMDV